MGIYNIEQKRLPLREQSIFNYVNFLGCMLLASDWFKKQSATVKAHTCALSWHSPLMQTPILISVTGKAPLPSFSSVNVSIPSKLIKTLFVLYMLKFNALKCKGERKRKTEGERERENKKNCKAIVGRFKQVRHPSRWLRWRHLAKQVHGHTSGFSVTRTMRRISL